MDSSILGKEEKEKPHKDICEMAHHWNAVAFIYNARYSLYLLVLHNSNNKNQAATVNRAIKDTIIIEMASDRNEICRTSKTLFGELVNFVT